MDDSSQLDDRLRSIEEASKAYDAGEEAAAKQIASSLVEVFSARGSETALLTRLNATYARVASSVGKAPHPQDVYTPLTEVLIDLGMREQHIVSAAQGPLDNVAFPRFQPYRDRLRVFRQVQAPDWWKTEPVFVIDHSKVTRREIAHWAIGDEPAGRFEDRFGQLFTMILRRNAQKVGATPVDFSNIKMPASIACLPALRQIAHELSKSAELLKLAGRPVKA
jgi:hypothetical protein